jgi:hypothetical protein
MEGLHTVGCCLVPQAECVHNHQYFLPTKSFITETGRSHGHIQQCLQQCLYIDIVVCPNSLSPVQSTSSAVKTPENREEDPDDLEAADEGNTKWNTPLISCTAQV